jgi:transcriptional regulator with XRE-family HTH domain
VSAVRGNGHGRRYRERRYELDLTQQEVARRAGTSHSFISKLESGDHIPTIPVLNRLIGASPGRPALPSVQCRIGHSAYEPPAQESAAMLLSRRDVLRGAGRTRPPQALR